MTIDAYPLQWPTGWERATKREPGRYQVSFARARDQVLTSLRRMGVPSTAVVISSNIPLRRDGLPYANTREPADPGVAVYWWDGAETRVIACDCWETTRGNLRAIGLSLEALRSLERAGASQILDRAFQGFAALPERAGVSSWRTELGMVEVADPDVAAVERAYRQRALDCHPDRGGSHEAMARLNAAREQALAAIDARIEEVTGT